ncbi:MAG: hypothetical protein K0S47_4452 [Herbinix sp.]|jgi:hypothetical protein|nr:hypothetical protein [Herbinix sp.]
MGKAKKRTLRTIITMIMVTAVLIPVYFYITNRINNEEENPSIQKTEIEVLKEKDLELNYPASPREVIKLYSRFLKSLYSDINEEDFNTLAIKIRDLYDNELLGVNPEEEYLNNLSSEIAGHRKNGGKISNYLIEKSDLVQYSEKEGKEYATINASFTIWEKTGLTKTTEKFLLRKDSEGKWRILGWEIIPDIDIETD